MVGIATKFAALDLLQTRLSASADPNLVNLGKVIQNNPEWAAFGALGDSYGDFSPVRVPASGTIGSPGANPYVQIWKLVFGVFEGDGSASNPGLKPVLDTIRTLLDKLDTIAAAEDLNGLKAMQGQVSTINQIAADIQAIITTIKGDGTLSNLGIVPAFAGLISNVAQPPIIRPRPDGNVGFPAKYWTLREFLSWRRTGKFAKALWKNAQSSGKDELKAYALGWLSSWALSAGGGSAIASIIGAPYRNEWWRARFVCNYVDLWSFGYQQKGPTFSGTDPTPPYSDWPLLCDAELQKRIEVPGSTLDPDAVMTALGKGNALGGGLPGFFTDYWTGTYEQVYADLDPMRPQVTADNLKDAYAMAWVVLWFQSSAQSIGCQAVMPTAPTKCSAAPSWTDPTVAGDAGGGAGGPPAPSVDPKLKPENVVCAIILAILGIVALCTGGYVAGGAAIAGAIALAASAGTIDWDKFRCDLAWYRLYLFNGLRALHDLLSLGALVHPYTNELSDPTTRFDLLKDVPTSYETGVNILVTKYFNNDNKSFPPIPWDGTGYDWIHPPSRSPEEPVTVPAIAEAFPSGFIDDASNPLGSATPFAPGPWPQDVAGFGGIGPLGFINSMDALIAALASPLGILPDWNLDGDRGDSFQTWVFPGDAWTNPVNIAKEP